MSEVGNYIIGKTIGQGTFSKVCQAKNQIEGHEAAVKILEKNNIQEIEDIERIKKEIQIFRHLKHPQIIQLYEVVETDLNLYLFMEYATGGELFDYINRIKQVPEIEACRIFHQLISGLEYLHNMDIIHRDLKPENILLTINRDVLIADFGLSNIQKDFLTTSCGSPCYAAPEMILGKPYNGKKTDMWSCGVILFAMLCGYLPFEDSNTQNLYQKILNAQYKFPKLISNDARDLIRKLLDTNIQSRYTIQQIKKHRWWNLWKKENPGMSIFKAKNKIANCNLQQDSKYQIQDIIFEQKITTRRRQSSMNKSPPLKSPLTKSPNTKSTTSKLSSSTYKQVYEKIKMKTPSHSLYESNGQEKVINQRNNKQVIQPNQQINSYAVFSQTKKKQSTQQFINKRSSNFQQLVQKMYQTMKVTQLSQSFKTPPKLFYSHTRNNSEIDSKLQTSKKLDISQQTQQIIQSLTNGLNNVNNYSKQIINTNIRGLEIHRGPFHLQFITRKHPENVIESIRKYVQQNNHQIIGDDDYTFTILINCQQSLELQFKKLNSCNVYYLEIISKDKNEIMQTFLNTMLQNIKF